MLEDLGIKKSWIYARNEKIGSLYYGMLGCVGNEFFCVLLSKGYGEEIFVDFHFEVH